MTDSFFFILLNNYTIYRLLCLKMILNLMKLYGSLVEVLNNRKLSFEKRKVLHKFVFTLHYLTTFERLSCNKVFLHFLNS